MNSVLSLMMLLSIGIVFWKIEPMTNRMGRGTSLMYRLGCLLTLVGAFGLTVRLLFVGMVPQPEAVIFSVGVAIQMLFDRRTK